MPGIDCAANCLKAFQQHPVSLAARPCRKGWGLGPAEAKERIVILEIAKEGKKW